MLRNYELTYLISPELSQEELKSSQEKIISLIQNEGGIFNEANSPIKKNLFYPIKKKQSAFLVSLAFQLAPEKLDALEKQLRAEEKILRYLIISKQKIKPIATFRKRMILKKPLIPRKKAADEKVELEKIEKKLEEILGE